MPRFRPPQRARKAVARSSSSSKGLVKNAEAPAFNGGTNQGIVLSSKDDDVGRRRNSQVAMHLQATHLRHMNVNQATAGR